MTHDYAVTNVEPMRDQLAETLSTTPRATKASAAAMRFPTRTWQALLRNSRCSQQPDFAWTVMREESNPGPALESHFSENRPLQAERTTSGTRPYELLLLSVLLLAAISYISWQEIKAYWLHTPTSAQGAATAIQEDEVALIAMEVDPSALDSLPVPYRSKHFYRRVAGIWQPSTPSAAYWGNRHTRETAYFRLEFTEHNAPVVEVVAADLDAILRTLHRQVGLEPPSRQQKLVIEVLPDAGHHWRTLDPFNPPAALPVSSPTLLPIPTSLTEADMLRGDIIQYLASLTLFRKMAPQSHEAWWNDSGVQGVLRWLIDHGQAGSVMLSHPYAVYQRWPSLLVDNPPPQLAELSIHYRQPHTHSLYLIENDWMPALDRQVMTVESMIDYALTKYGQEHLPHPKR